MNESILFTRRSVRKFNNQPISNDDLNYILSAAMHAPSAGNGQEWEFVVINDHAILKALVAGEPKYAPLNTATLAIAVCYVTENSPYKHRPLCLANAAAATQNILLAATERAIGSVWMAIDGVDERYAMVSKLLSLPSDASPYALIGLGYSDMVVAQPQDRFNIKKIHYNSY